MQVEGGAGTTPAPTCPCGIEGRPPWRIRGHTFGRASAVFGLVVLGFGATALAVGLRDWVGLLVGGVYVASTVAALAFVTQAGHRGSCRVRRGVWTGLAALGVPLRVAATLGF